MKKIVDENAVDIIPCSGGILFARKQMVSEDKCKVSFHAVDINKMKSGPIMKGHYLRAKFGENYRRITKELGDYLFCDTAVYRENYLVIVYPTGETGLFDQNGKALWAGDLLYHESPIHSVAPDGQQLWCTVPEQNAIISYSIQHKKFYMRIGSKTSSAFENPRSIVKYGNELFVCSTDANKIRVVQLSDYSVQDFRTFDEPVYKYMRVCGKEIVQLESGVYIL